LEVSLGDEVADCVEDIEVDELEDIETVEVVLGLVVDELETVLVAEPVGLLEFGTDLEPVGETVELLEVDTDLESVGLVLEDFDSKADLELLELVVEDLLIDVLDVIEIVGTVEGDEEGKADSDTEADAEDEAVVETDCVSLAEIDTLKEIVCGPVPVGEMVSINVAVEVTVGGLLCIELTLELLDIFSETVPVELIDDVRDWLVEGEVVGEAVVDLDFSGLLVIVGL
jgi:hypothetical protein